MRRISDMMNPVKDALLSISDNVGHYIPIDGERSHIVYAEDMEASEVTGDNIKMAYALQGTIDLYARPEDIDLADDIQESLNKYGVSFQLNSVLYDDKQKSQFVHFEWIFEVT